MFQSTLPHEERPHPSRPIRPAASFNPRSRTRSDKSVNVSNAGYAGFNPRSRTRSDPISLFTEIREKSFQSTLPHEERLLLDHGSLIGWSFQSTLPHEERRVIRIVFIDNEMFQSTLPHEERPVRMVGAPRQ